jgi:methionine-rich copper-binding protein CopC
VLITCLLTKHVAAGHAVLQRAEPRVESKLKRSPDEVKLYFTERLEPAYGSLRVLDDRDVQVDRRDSRVDRANPALLRATLPPLPPGTYKVLWRVRSIDADVTEGRFAFRIDEGAPPRCAVGSPRVQGGPDGGILHAAGRGLARRTERATWDETVVRWGRLLVLVAIGYKLQSNVIDRGMRGSEQHVAIPHDADDLARSPRPGGASSRVSRDGPEARAPHGASPIGTHL